MMVLVANGRARAAGLIFLAAQARTDFRELYLLYVPSEDASSQAKPARVRHDHFLNFGLTRLVNNFVY